MPAFFAPERLEDARFTIRGYLPGDGPAMAEGKIGSTAHLAPWLPWAGQQETVEANEALARTFHASYLTNRDFVMGVWAPGGDRLLGGTGFHLRGYAPSLEDRTGEIGMWIRAEEAGRGLGTAVLQAMLRWGFTEWPWERLAWRCDARNTASRRVAEKAGMRLEGTLRGEKADVGEGRRDTLVFGLVRADLGDGAINPAR